MFKWLETKNCWLFHDWSKWQQYQQDYIGTFRFGNKKGEKYEFTQEGQRRTCQKCGFVEEKRKY